MFLHPVLRLFPDFETPSVVVLKPLKKECMYAEIYELHGIPAAAMSEGIGTSALRSGQSGQTRQAKCVVYERYFSAPTQQKKRNKMRFHTQTGTLNNKIQQQSHFIAISSRLNICLLFHPYFFVISSIKNRRNNGELTKKYRIYVLFGGFLLLHNEFVAGESTSKSVGMRI